MAQTQTHPSRGRREAPFLKKYREFWYQERAAAWLYRELADIADDDDAPTLRRLAAAEDVHAGHWADLLERSGAERPAEFKPPRRERFLRMIAKRFGVDRVIPMLVRLEAADAGKYLNVQEAPRSMSEEEVAHGRTLAMLGHGTPRRIADIESRHRVSSGGALRAATFGINDGLVSNLALIMGVAGGADNPSIVLLAGVAGLLAGAFSMAAGEWVSVRSQTELYEREIEIEQAEIEAFPEEEREELATIYRAKGLEPEAADKLAERIMLRPKVALDTLVREELGLDPGELGSPWVAAISSFVAFAVGAFVPLAPWIFTGGGVALGISAGGSGVVLALVGLSISVLTGRSGFVSASRMLLVGGLAAAVTYGVGSLVGVSLG
ncbi:MAG TPA: VIT1/CCC1 transporter family protein [Actinomycetota bacterium]